MNQDCPISAVTRGRQVLVGHDQVVQSADYDFSSLTLIQTVIYFTIYQQHVDQSWYRGEAHIYLKISATEHRLR